MVSTLCRQPHKSYVKNLLPRGTESPQDIARRLNVRNCLSLHVWETCFIPPQDAGAAVLSFPALLCHLSQGSAMICHRDPGRSGAWICEVEQEDSHRGQEGTLGSVRDADLGVYRSWVEGAGSLRSIAENCPKGVISLHVWHNLTAVRRSPLVHSFRLG